MAVPPNLWSRKTLCRHMSFHLEALGRGILAAHERMKFLAGSFVLSAAAGLSLSRGGGGRHFSNGREACSAAAGLLKGKTRRHRHELPGGSL